MDVLPWSDQSPQQLGEAWIQALMGKDFQRLSGLCQPDVRSRLMTPGRVRALESAPDLSQEIEGWFGACTDIQNDHSRVALVGEKLAIFYRLRLEDEGEPSTIEQQLFCSLREGRIDQLSLLCSGFQPDSTPEGAPGAPATNAKTTFPSNALLEFNVTGGQESTCAILTPSIKRKLGEMSSGQVLEVRVDDPTAKEDIEAWCRLSGNRLLNLVQGEGQELRFYVQKK